MPKSKRRRMRLSKSQPPLARIAKATSRESSSRIMPLRRTLMSSRRNLRPPRANLPKRPAKAKRRAPPLQATNRFGNKFQRRPVRSPLLLVILPAAQLRGPPAGGE